MSDEKEYIKGFNNGYILSKHEPELTQKITANLAPSTNYLEGFFSGKEEYEIEHSKEQLNELEQLRNSSKEKDRDLEQEQ